MRARVRNDQKKYRLPTEALSRLTQWLQLRANRLHKTSQPDHVTLILTDDAGIRDVHEYCFGNATPTDVISLNYDPIPGEALPEDGEVIVNVQCACRIGQERRSRAHGQSSDGRQGWSPERELALYVAHGCDHLAGGRDDTPQARARMRRRELRWVADAERLGLLDFSIIDVDVDA